MCNIWLIFQVKDLTHLPFAERELMLIKIAVNAAARRDVLDIASIFRARAVDVSDHTITLEVGNLRLFLFLMVADKILGGYDVVLKLDWFIDGSKII